MWKVSVLSINMIEFTAITFRYHKCPFFSFTRGEIVWAQFAPLHAAHLFSASSSFTSAMRGSVRQNGLSPVVGKHYRPIYGRAMALLSKYASYLCSVGIQSANLLKIL